MTRTTKLRELVKQRIRQIEDQAGQAREDAGVVELDPARVGRLSRMDALQMQQMELALDQRQKQQLAALQQALVRIENDAFGLCEECGKPINPKRLEIDPAVTLCIDCATAGEVEGRSPT